MGGLEVALLCLLYVARTGQTVGAIAQGGRKRRARASLARGRHSFEQDAPSGASTRAPRPSTSSPG
eukprot:scaffold209_cov396-Prasinococcus_capsulatus_cf.AAC.2